MAQTQREKSTTSFRWDPEDEDRFIEALEQLQDQGEVTDAIGRSDAMRLVLNNFSEDPDPSMLR